MVWFLTQIKYYKIKYNYQTIKNLPGSVLSIEVRIDLRNVWVKLACGIKSDWSMGNCELGWWSILHWSNCSASASPSLKESDSLGKRLGGTFEHNL